MSQRIVITAAMSADLDPCPITPGWIRQGMPQARAKVLGMSEDKTSRMMAWECTPGEFDWHYGDEDEVVYILAGEVFITTGDGVERRLAAGDMAFFPAGSSCRWRVTQQVRKVAVLTRHMPRLVGLATRAWHKAIRMARLKGMSTPVMQPVG